MYMDSKVLSKAGLLHPPQVLPVGLSSSRMDHQERRPIMSWSNAGAGFGTKPKMRKCSTPDHGSQTLNRTFFVQPHLTGWGQVYPRKRGTTYAHTRVCTPCAGREAAQIACVTAGACEGGRENPRGNRLMVPISVAWHMLLPLWCCCISPSSPCFELSTYARAACSYEQTPRGSPWPSS